MLSNFEKGFAQYLEVGEKIEKYGGGRPPANLTRKFNDSIRMMASEDYETMRAIVVNEWSINRALQGWKPCDNGIAWRKCIS
ncbi:hypothetical protein M5X00_06280 [Paenibacillus alvei]|uniref:Uncharacterized protein n=1 Tax=Paenibacillus alvei TaxID=44250 RepID=A0ABT4H8T3_PAEAL|nr:hypothetical protein [Paenibacillus alvei]MCY9542670.1 hypothetical protein [Paenibacillus alvei]MCY9708726.1 hypothetical protein [Paenibacillus alvei]MCY9732268.1 hypothetical protein [Paenibacillus alvei]MCY9753863.1 hypothetical protein [Paenibacillus alvei]MCY9764997.1 hypothetical protein [Paenibacillus alvei]